MQYPHLALAAVAQMGLGRSAGGPYATVCEEVEKRCWRLPDDRLGRPR